MISLLTGYKKNLVRDTISYFIDTTGVSSEGFIVLVQKNNMKDPSKLGYKEWLAVKCFQLLKENDISLADCLEFKNLATQLKLEKRGMNLSSLWKKEIASVIESSGVQKYELFELSDRNSELNYLNAEKDVSFCNILDNNHNFFNTFDFDKDNKTLFNILPENIQKAIIYKLPIFINLNPYLEHLKNIDILLDDMRLYGFSKKNILNIFYGSLFRIIKFCEEYDLKDVRLGFFFPLDMFNEKVEYLDFYNYFKSFFVFNRGICFNPKSVGVKDKAEYIGYLIWDLNRNNKSKPVILEERVQHTDDTILKGSFRLFRGKKDSLYDWVKNSTMYNGSYDNIPMYLNIQTKGDSEIQRASNVLGYQLNSRNLLRSLKKIGVYSVPIGEYLEITVENFFKSVASYTVRNCLNDKIELTPVYLSNPDVTIEGYSTWLADAVVYFIFSPNNMTKSYREKDLTLVNRLFPLSFTEVRKYVTDENIINDMNVNKVENLPFIQILDDVLKNLDDVGSEFYSFCKKKIIESLLGNTRENAGYKNSLVAWDASFYQIRGIDRLFTSKEEDKYNYLLSKLKNRLNEGIYKYGFIDTCN